MANDMERVARHGPPRAIDAALLEAAQDANPVGLRRALASANAMRFDLRWHGAEHDVAAEALFAVIDARSAWQDRLACVRMLLKHDDEWYRTGRPFISDGQVALRTSSSGEIVLPILSCLDYIYFHTFGLSVLCAAARADSVEVVLELVKRGADATGSIELDNDGEYAMYTPLETAARHGNIETMTVLMKYGATLQPQWRVPAHWPAISPYRDGYYPAIPVDALSYFDRVRSAGGFKRYCELRQSGASARLSRYFPEEIVRLVFGFLA